LKSFEKFCIIEFQAAKCKLVKSLNFMTGYCHNLDLKIEFPENTFKIMQEVDIFIKPAPESIMALEIALCLLQAAATNSILPMREFLAAVHLTIN